MQKPFCIDERKFPGPAAVTLSYDNTQAISGRSAMDVLRVSASPDTS